MDGSGRVEGRLGTFLADHVSLCHPDPADLLAALPLAASAPTAGILDLQKTPRPAAAARSKASPKSKVQSLKLRVLRVTGLWTFHAPREPRAHGQQQQAKHPDGLDDRFEIVVMSLK